MVPFTSGRGQSWHERRMREHKDRFSSYFTLNGCACDLPGFSRQGIMEEVIDKRLTSFNPKAASFRPGTTEVLVALRAQIRGTSPVHGLHRVLDLAQAPRPGPSPSAASILARIERARREGGSPETLTRIMKMHYDQVTRGQAVGSMPPAARDSRELLSCFTPPPQRLASRPAACVQGPHRQHPDGTMSALHEVQQQGHWKLTERLQTPGDIYKLRRNMQGPMPSSADIVPEDVKYTRLVLSQQQRMLKKTITEWPAIHTQPETSLYSQHQGMLPAVYRPTNEHSLPRKSLDTLSGLDSDQRVPPTLAHAPPLQDTQQLSPSARPRFATNAQEQQPSFSIIPGLGAHVPGSGGSQQVPWDIPPMISTARTREQKLSPFARSSVSAKAQDKLLPLAHTPNAPNAQTSFARPSVVTNTNQCPHEFEVLANHQGRGGRERAFADGWGMEDEKKKEQPEEDIPDKWSGAYEAFKVGWDSD